MTISILREISDNRINAFKTGAFMLSFLGLGLFESSIGPSLLDLMLAFDGSLSDVVWVMPASMVGYILGAFIIGFLLYPRINPFLCDMLALLSSAILLALVAYNRTLVGMLLTFMANGFALGIIDAIGHSTILIMWGKACDPFMQLLHSSFGLGGILGPLIVSPFLVPSQDGDRRNNSDVLPTKSSFNSDDLRIQTAYQIISIFLACISTPFLYIYLRHRVTNEHSSRMTTNDTNSNVQVHHLNRRIFKTVVILATAFMTIYYGLEIAMASFMTPFAFLSELQVSKATGAIMTTVYWSTYTILQLLTVFYINIVGPEKNIIFLLIVTMIGNCFLVPFGNAYIWCLWTGAALMGTGMSALWGSIYGYLENYFPITTKIAAGFTIFSCFGELVIPNLMGAFIDKTPTIFLWIIFACSLSICVLFAATNVLCRKYLIEPSPRKLEDKGSE